MAALSTKRKVKNASDILIRKKTMFSDILKERKIIVEISLCQTVSANQVKAIKNVIFKKERMERAYMHKFGIPEDWSSIVKIKH